MRDNKYIEVNLPSFRIPVGWLHRPMLGRLVRLLLPTPGNVLFTMLVVGGLLFASQAGALPLRAPALAGDSTTTISYQGRLADGSGNPITSPGVAIQFRLYDVDTGGAPLWEETQVAVPVEDGLFHVLLGSTNHIPVSLLASNSTLWLGVTVGSDSEMTPREQIASVPYAMVASTVPDGSVTQAKAPTLARAKSHGNEGVKIEVFTVTCNSSGGCDYWFTVSFSETPMMLKSAFDNSDISNYGPNPTNHEALHAISQPNSTHTLVAIGR